MFSQGKDLKDDKNRGNYPVMIVTKKGTRIHSIAEIPTLCDNYACRVMSGDVMKNKEKSKCIASIQQVNKQQQQLLSALT